MAIDGLVLDVPDTPDNDEEFGRCGNDQTPGPFPQVRLVALGECGTHAVVDAELGGVGTGEGSEKRVFVSDRFWQGEHGVVEVNLDAIAYPGLVRRGGR